MHRLVPHVLPIVVPFMPLLTEYWDSGKAIMNFDKEVGFFPVRKILSTFAKLLSSP